MLDIERPYNFEIPKHTRIKDEPRNWLKVLYPKQRASVDITYLKVNDNLRELILESEKLVFEHTVKADQISSNDYIDLEKRVFGTFYEITGDAASQIQFHLTDSTHHFLKGALYFRTKPNYDSIFTSHSSYQKRCTSHNGNIRVEVRQVFSIDFNSYYSQNIPKLGIYTCFFCSYKYVTY